MLPHLVWTLSSRVYRTDTEDQRGQQDNQEDKNVHGEHSFTVNAAARDGIVMGMRMLKDERKPLA
jgi:hypothetical protein